MNCIFKKIGQTADFSKQTPCDCSKYFEKCHQGSLVPLLMFDFRQNVESSPFKLTDYNLLTPFYVM